MKQAGILLSFLVVFIAHGCFSGVLVHAQGLSDQDSRFLLNAYSRNVLGEELSQLAIERAWNDEVRRLAQQALNNHATENLRLTALADRKGISLPDKPARQFSETIENFRELDGHDFDQAYVHEIARLHAEDIDDFRRQASDGTDPDLVRFSRGRIRVSQTQLWLTRQVGELIAKRW
jgi:putative membrane protein